LALIGFEIAMVMRAEDLHGLVRGEAFRHLLAAGVPATGEDLATSIGLPADKVARVLEELSTSGRIRRDEAGQVVGSAGLSVVADRYQIDFEGRRFWTWCAYDILGIFGALRATGTAVSRSPATAAPITVRFRDGRPEAAGVVLFLPSDSLAASCTSVYEEWCPNSNFFEDAGSASAWSTSHKLEGRVLSLEEASDLATAEWLPLTRPQLRRSP
jgi:alkylmercury lyase